MTAKYTRDDMRAGGIVLACIAGLSVSYSGIYFVTFSLFMGPLQAEFGWSRGTLSALMSLVNVTLAVSTPFIGNLCGRYGAPRVLTIAILGFAAAVAGLGASPNSIPVFALLCVAIGVAGAGTNTFVYLSILPRWFSSRLGLALGITMTGIGLGHTLMPLLAQHLIEAIGWRSTYLVLAGLALVVALPGALTVLRQKPPFGPKAKTDATVARPSLYRSSAFWLYCYVFFAIAVIASGCAIHAIPMMVDRGLTPMKAVTLGAAGGISVLVARLTAGYLLDVFGTRVVATASFLCAAVAPLVYLPFAPVAVLVAAPILLGLAIGVEGDLMPYSVKRYFGLDNYEVIYSRLFTAYTAGVAVGPVIMGFGYDRLGTYNPILFFFSLVALSTIPTFFAATRASVDGAEPAANPA